MPMEDIISGTIIAFDPATHTGCCVGYLCSKKYDFWKIRTFSLKPIKEPTLGYYIRKIRQVVDKYDPDWVAWEESYVRNYTSARLQFGIAGIIQGYAETRKSTMIAIHPSSIKQRATGNGRASKDEVGKAAKEISPCEIDNDNEADAFWIWVMAYEQISGVEF